MPALIEDYALIGDCRAAALVNRSGSIDWLCLPRFDSQACCAALLGGPEHGRWSVRPVGEPLVARRRYRRGTLVLETDMECGTGRIRVIDFMAPCGQTPAVYRIIQGLHGVARVKSELRLRFDYGANIAWVERSGTDLKLLAGPDAAYYRTQAPTTLVNDLVVSEFDLSAGETMLFALAWGRSHEPSPPIEDPMLELATTESWWRQWSDRCTFQGRWEADVRDSLITLKALTYHSTGGIVAAPTTSLPEKIGGSRNWDYRYCWLRDATFTLYAFLIGGYVDEARAWREWLVRAVAGDPAQMQIMYGVGGERRLDEIELGWLPGYEGSRPVRIGNGAYRQHQLDVPGEVMEALHLSRRYGLDAHDGAWRIQQAIMDSVERTWSKPDEGIWEVRGERRHFTHSKVMAWVAADRAVKEIEQFGLPGSSDRWRELRDRIRSEVMAQGYNEEKKAFTQYYGATEPDASLLMLPLVGFVDARDPKMTGTVRLIEERLVRQGLVDRYVTESHVDGLPAGEGAFLLCSFWLADNLALQGRIDEATELFQHLLSLRNDVGLLAEEYDPVEKRMLGNFPQAFSHVGLVNTARNLAGSGGPAEDRSTEEGSFDDL